MTNWQDEHPGNDYPGPEGPETIPAAGVPSDNPSGCGGGTVGTQLDSVGQLLPGGSWQCVSPEEAQRRLDLTHGPEPNPETPAGPKPAGGGGGSKAPSGGPTYKFEPIPEFTPPDYGFSELWKEPTAEEAFQDPGYQFAQRAGLSAIQNAAAARGGLRTGGAYKGLASWANDYATQKYGDVRDRLLSGYNTRRDTYNMGYDRRYTAAKDMYAPRLHEWDVKTAFGTQSARDAFEAAWKKWFWDNPSATDILNAGRP